MWKESKSLHGKVDLVLCTAVEIGVPPGGGPWGWPLGVAPEVEGVNYFVWELRAGTINLPKPQ